MSQKSEVRSQKFSWQQLWLNLLAQKGASDCEFEDDLQEAMIAVLRRFGGQPAVPVGEATAYATAAARRIRATRLRRKRPLLVGNENLVLTPALPIVSDSTAAADLSAFLRHHLHEKRAQVVELRLSGLGVKATARRLGTSPCSVRRSIKAWHETLRILLQEWKLGPP